MPKAWLTSKSAGWPSAPSVRTMKRASWRVKRVAWRGPSKRVSAKSARTLAGLAGAIAWRCLEPSKAAACRGWQAAHSVSAM